MIQCQRINQRIVKNIVIEDGSTFLANLSKKKCCDFLERSHIAICVGYHDSKFHIFNTPAAENFLFVFFQKLKYCSADLVQRPHFCLQQRCDKVRCNCRDEKKTKVKVKKTKFCRNKDDCQRIERVVHWSSGLASDAAIAPVTFLPTT